MAYIRFEHVTKCFGEHTVLKDIHMEIEKGSLVTFLGPSGCGKSTMLRCLAGLEEVTNGHIYLDGQEITHLSPSERNIGMVFQQYSLFPNMTVEQNIAFGLKMMKTPKDQREEKVSNAIKLVELEGKEKACPANLSGGQQQRVALARSIVMQPKVLLLDEPLSAIDAKLRKSLQSRIREIHKELDLTIIFVTHDQDEAMVMSDVIKLFNDGKIEQSGTPVSMYTAPKTKFAASFIGNYNILSTADFASLVGDEETSAYLKKQAAEVTGTDMVCTDSVSEIAIRPETIRISKQPTAETEEFLLRGRIHSSSPRGNVLRYRVDVRGILLNADVLFRSFTLFEDGAEVYLHIPKRDCLSLA